LFAASLLAMAALVLACPTVAWAQREQEETPPRADKAKAQDKAKADRAKTELDQARAEVKKLRAEMDRLHKQMRETALKLSKAQTALAQKEAAGTRKGQRHHWVRFGWGQRWGGWRRFEPAKSSHQDLEKKVDRLQKEVEQLRRELKKPR